MILTTLMGLFGCAKKPSKKPPEPVTSVESMTLTLRGMRGGDVYRFEISEEKTELCHYYEKYKGEDTILELDASVACTTDEMIELMNKCGIMNWDGFHGPHPRNVLDGTMFTFSAEVNGGRRIYADGSENFPKGYYEFVVALREMLDRAD
ncbi:MAG: hypothetical protein E7628_04575 [Ruminococcaceae bacterium]|nr:hypothetical protein [Oscillospiraceae bacterium]